VYDLPKVDTVSERNVHYSETKVSTKLPVANPPPTSQVEHWKSTRMMLVPQGVYFI